MRSGEATDTNCIVFGLTRSGFEPTIYRTRGEHTNHYTADSIKNTHLHFYLDKHDKLLVNFTLGLVCTIYTYYINTDVSLSYYINTDVSLSNFLFTVHNVIITNNYTQ